MNKRVINEIENKKNTYKINGLLLTILLLLLCFTTFISTLYVDKYFKDKKIIENQERIDIVTSNVSASIVNDGIIEETILKEHFKKNKNKVTIERINTLDLSTLDKKPGSLKIDLRYRITKNDFKQNLYATNKSDVLVKFSYSNDLENWTYLNNVISLNVGNLNALVGNTYDIAGLKDELKILTNYEVKTDGKKNKRIYFRSETIFQNSPTLKNKSSFSANFTIEYNSSK